MTDMSKQIAVHIGDPVRGADDQEIGVVKAVDSQNMTVERQSYLGSAYLIPVSTVTLQSGGTLRLNVTKEEIEANGWEAPEQS